MRWKRDKVETIMGWRLAPPQLTFGALVAAAKYIFLPVLTALALLDFVLYLFFQHVLDRCYGILCFFA